MEWWEILILTIGIICVVYVAYLVLSVKLHNKSVFIKKLDKVINSAKEEYNIVATPSHSVHDLEIKADKDYLIKLIRINPKHEIIITNAKKVVINDDIKGWKRSTKAHFVSKMESFIDLAIKDNQMKIALIYPDCYNVTKYINESDAFIVEKFQKVDGIYFIRMKELLEFLKKD